LPELKHTLVVPQQQDAIEIDEVGSFVRRKGQRAWVWIALCFQSRPVRAMVVGERSAKTCRKLWERIPEAYRPGTCLTDFYEVYNRVIPRDQHQAGKKGSALTNAVERFNLTLRQRLGRRLRKTLSFSRSWSMHLLCLRIFIDRYNRYCIQRFQIDNPQMLTTYIEPRPRIQGAPSPGATTSRAP
jgi:insertion element IS1 protein InsB